MRPIARILNQIGDQVGVEEFQVTDQHLEHAWKTVHDMTFKFLEDLPLIVIGIVVFFIFVVLARWARGLTSASCKTTDVDPVLADFLGNLTSFGVKLTGVLVALLICLPGFQPIHLLTGLGLSSVAIGFVFKDFLANFLAGILILWKHPYSIGDIILVDTFEGVVEEITIRATRIKTYDGELVVRPNWDLYSQTITVKTAFGTRRASLDLVIDTAKHEDVRKVKESVLSVVADTVDILEDPEPTIYVTQSTPSMCKLVLFFWYDPGKSVARDIRDRVILNVRQSLEVHKIPAIVSAGTI